MPGQRNEVSCKPRSAALVRILSGRGKGASCCPKPAIFVWKNASYCPIGTGGLNKYS